jgi:hypothetical protein
VYIAKVAGSGPFVRDAVAPKRLVFTVTVSGALPAANESMSGAVVWLDGVRRVRSPIIVHTVPN